MSTPGYHLLVLYDIYVRCPALLKQGISTNEWIPPFIQVSCGCTQSYPRAEGHSFIACVTGIWRVCLDRFFDRFFDPHCLVHRFFGLFGIYYSLQYLSLSDAVVLTFLTPTCTAVASSIFLGEIFHLRQAVASREPVTAILLLAFSDSFFLFVVISLSGVILIARPAAIFGHPSDLPGGSRPGETVSGADRLLAVGYVAAVYKI